MNPVIHTPGPVRLATVPIRSHKPATSRFGTGARGSSDNDPFKDLHCLSLVVTRLRDVRQRRGISLREVSRRAHVDEDFIDLAENGRMMPDSRIFKAWCRALNLSWDQVWRDSLG
jgi:ribosome-binding protein aMBF1 (putative translation factor)